MTKDSSIETIKKELINRMMNNVEVLKYLEVDKFTDKGRHGKIQDVYNSIIFDYDSGDFKGNFMAVEVGEREFSASARNDSKNCTISIRMGLDHKENLDKLASAIKDIISNLYPNRKKYSNVPFYGTNYGFNGTEYKELNRMITFEIEQ